MTRVALATPLNKSLILILITYFLLKKIATKETMEERLLGVIECALPHGSTLIKVISTTYRVGCKILHSTSNLAYVLSSVAFIGFMPGALEQERLALLTEREKRHREVMLGTASPAVSPSLPPGLLMPDMPTPVLE